MPVYDYKCQEHGIFNELATVDESDRPAACPDCGALSARIIMLAPQIFTMAPELKKAHAINERSQHEPAFSTPERLVEDEEHARGCGCTHSASPSKLLLTARGEKMFPSMRPWMISH